jgi:quercetin dioxygenase-like cupin family protein
MCAFDDPVDLIVYMLEKARAVALLKTLEDPSNIVFGNHKISYQTSMRQPKDRGFMKRILCLLLVATLPFGSVLADAPKSKNAKVTLVYQHELPNVPGKSIKGVLVEYGPGGYSPGHTHAKSAFIYATVLEGAIRSQVNDGPVTTYKAGQSFSELPGDRHGVSANASKTEPAKLLAVFVVDTNETELTIPFGN